MSTAIPATPVDDSWATPAAGPWREQELAHLAALLDLTRYLQVRAADTDPGLHSRVTAPLVELTAAIRTRAPRGRPIPFSPTVGLRQRRSTSERSSPAELLLICRAAHRLAGRLLVVSAAQEDLDVIRLACRCIEIFRAASPCEESAAPESATPSE
ncbi:hypothetical protein [Streptomyces sp. GQFP]|uniref:hypothetical protein n=1 Tax=Streptomyces sp. GQFP TaxID=2907545 RepID=UPI001F2E7846|nr:hypothetical protein [Streptomyces sp. GQFP]UIX29260.1 hypothetical protein LUX31_04030 [Streptomyces sp. GQFP]